MDTWYDCQECSGEASEEFEAFQQSAEYRIGWVPPSRRAILKFYKITTILRKIPREAAERWVACMDR